ncbi:helix-turn-helix domain-containing protein [Streptomyces sp. NPDC054838]
MPTIISSLSHPYWTPLGSAAHESRTRLGLSQANVAKRLGLLVRDYAALESGFIPPEVSDALGKVPLDRLDTILEWDKGTSREIVGAAIEDAIVPSRTAAYNDRGNSTYSAAAWIRLGKAVQKARLALHMNKNVLGYAMKSTSKTVLRLEEGRVYGDPRTAPPGDYNSEKYMIKRLPLLEMALEWDYGAATEILEG